MRSNIFNEDFIDFLSSLNDANVKYILIGGYAVILHGYNRTTGDLDIWVERSETNYNRLRKAFDKFGMPMFDMTIDRFINNEQIDVFRFGRPPVSIDLMVNVKGLSFQDCYLKSSPYSIEGISINLIHVNDLIKGKKASDRNKDRDDIEHLT